jgi:hypothetical protein
MSRTAQVCSTPNRSLCVSMNSTSAEIEGRVLAASRISLAPEAHELPFRVPRCASCSRSWCRTASRCRLPPSRPSCGASRIDAELVADACQGAAAASRLGTRLENHRHRAIPQLSRMPLALMSRVSPFPEVTASWKLGAVQGRHLRCFNLETPPGLFVVDMPVVRDYGAWRSVQTKSERGQQWKAVTMRAGWHRHYVR